MRVSSFTKIYNVHLKGIKFEHEQKTEIYVLNYNAYKNRITKIH